MGALGAGAVPKSGAGAGAGAGAITPPDSLATLLAPRLAPVAWFRFYTREELRRRESARLTAQVGRWAFRIRMPDSNGNSYLVAVTAYAPCTLCCVPESYVSNFALQSRSR